MAGGGGHSPNNHVSACTSTTPQSRLCKPLKDTSVLKDTFSWVGGRSGTFMTANSTAKY